MRDLHLAPNAKITELVTVMLYTQPSGDSEKQNHVRSYPTRQRWRPPATLPPERVPKSRWRGPQASGAYLPP